MKSEHVTHPFGPVFDENSRILILGSLPSVKSREVEFYYGNPQNRFWALMARLLGVDLPADVEGKRAMLLAHRIALWDVIESCDVVGSSDSSIRNAQPNDVASLVRRSKVERIYLNGQTAYRLYRRHLESAVGVPAFPLPSTSPANAAWSLDRLTDAWRVILE